MHVWLTEIHKLFNWKRRRIEAWVEIQHFGQARHGRRDGRESHGKNTHLEWLLPGSLCVCVCVYGAGLWFGISTGLLSSTTFDRPRYERASNSAGRQCKMSLAHLQQPTAARTKPCITTLFVRQQDVDRAAHPFILSVPIGLSIFYRNFSQRTAGNVFFFVHKQNNNNNNSKSIVLKKALNVVRTKVSKIFVFV